MADTYRPTFLARRLRVRACVRLAYAVTLLVVLGLAGLWAWGLRRRRSAPYHDRDRRSPGGTPVPVEEPSEDRARSRLVPRYVQRLPNLLARARGWGGVTKAPWVVLSLLVLAYVVGFTFWSARVHADFRTYTFDIGIFDQGVWLLSRFHDPFVTVRGLNLFADHSSFILLLVVPLYWLWDSPVVLLVTQTLAIGLAAIPLFLLARDLLESAWLGVAVAAVFLLNPAVEWTNLENFHPDSYELLFLAAALYFMVKQRWRWFLAFIALLLLVKEDVPLLVVPLGIYVGLRYKTRVGYYLALAAAVWLALDLFVIMPRFGEGGSVYWGRIPFGGPTGLLKTAFRDPQTVFAYVTQPERVDYVIILLSTLAFLPLLSPFVLVVAGTIAFNVLSTHGYQHVIKYHYSTLIVPTLIVAAVFAIARFDTLRSRAKLVGVVLVATVVSAYLLGPLPLSRAPGPAVTVNAPRNEAILEAMDLLPEDAVVSAHYSIVPHIAHRQGIYDWPNPFRAQYWGDASKEGQRLPAADDVEYAVLIPGRIDAKHRRLYLDLKADSDVVFSREGIEVLRVRTPDETARP
jgi:uncharacterized membrane protein